MNKKIAPDFSGAILLDGKFNVAEVASRVGYTNSSKFAQAFKEYTGCSPKEYKNKT